MAILPLISRLLSNKEILVTAGKVIWNFVKGLASKPAVNKKSTTQDIEAASLDLLEIKDNVFKKVSPIAKDINEEVMYYAEELGMLLEAKFPILQHYRYSRRDFDKKIAQLTGEIDIFFKNELTQRVSLDNQVCRTILIMQPGERKERALRDYIQSVIAEMITSYISHLKSTLANLYDELESEILDISEQMESTCEKYKELCESIDTGSQENQETIIAEALLKKELCSNVLALRKAV